MCGRIGASARDADRLSCPALPDTTAVILRTARFLQLDVFCHRAGGGNPLGVVVDAHDPAFTNPTKPIGPFFSEEDANHHREKDGWAVKEDAGRGWRRVPQS